MQGYTRKSLAETHRTVQHGYGPLNVWKAASVTCSKMAGRKTYTVEILGVAPFDRFTWSDRAHDAWEAREKAWRAFMRQ